MQRGEIKNREYAAQIRNFSGLRWQNITPTDVDGLIEYKDKCFVLMETKHNGSTLPHGQRLALQRLIDNLNKPAILFVSSHNTNEDIDMANTTLTDYYYKGAWKKVDKPVTLRYAVDWFINKHE